MQQGIGRWMSKDICSSCGWWESKRYCLPLSLKLKRNMNNFVESVFKREYEYIKRDYAFESIV